MHFPTISLIGAGNMGSAIIGGLIKNGHPNNQIIASDPSEEKLNLLKNEFGIRVSNNNFSVIQESDVVIFAIKPQIFSTVLTPLAEIIQKKKPLILSIAAGVKESTIQHLLGGNLPIIRIMPNTPALLGAGASGLFANHVVTENQKTIAEAIMTSLGLAIWVKTEEDIDTVTALSGSGPAYFFLIMEAMVEAACELGLSEETAVLLTAQTAYGAACMAKQKNISLKTLRQNVTSPNGTTEKGIAVLEEAHIRAIFKQTLLAAKKRSIELAKENQ